MKYLAVVFFLIFQPLAHSQDYGVAGYCEELKSQELEGKSVAVSFAGGASVEGVVAELRPKMLVLNKNGELTHYNCDHVVSVQKITRATNVVSVVDSQQEN